MSIEPKFEIIKSNCFKQFAPVQIVANCIINAGENVKVDKVLTISADVRIISVESLPNEISISGRVNYKVLYLNSEGKLCSTDYLSDFNDKANVEGVVAAMKIIASGKIIDTDVTVSENAISISAVLEITMSGILVNQINALTNVDKAFAKKDKKFFMEMAAMADGSIEIDEEYDLNEKIERVLLFDTNIILKDCKSGEGKVIVEGVALASLTLETERGIDTKFYTLPFAEEVIADGAVTGQQVYAEINVKSNKVVLSNDGKTNIMRLEIIASVKAPVFMMKEIDIINDVFSPNCRMNCNSGKYQAERIERGGFFEEKISGVASLNENMPSIANIITTCAIRNTTTNLVAEDGYIIAEGLLTASVLYLDYDNKTNCVAVELPYSLKESMPNIKKGFNLKGKIVESIVSARVRRDKEIEINADLKIYIDAFYMIEDDYIVDVKEGEEITCDAAAISIYIASKGDMIWDIAKALCASPDTIKSLNPNLIEPLKGSEKVTIYRHRNINDTVN